MISKLSTERSDIRRSKFFFMKRKGKRRKDILRADERGLAV